MNGRDGYGPPVSVYAARFDERTDVDGDRVEQLLEEILIELRALNDVTVWAANPRDLGRSWTAEKRDEVLARKREYMRQQMETEQG